MLKALLTLCAAVAVARADSSTSTVTASTTESQSMPASATASFDISNVTSTDLFNWCHAQLITCPEICDGSASVNYCDQTTLAYSCICSNGTVPDCTAFINTVPYYECQETYIQCIADNPNDAEAQATCASNEECGTRNATAEELAASSASAAAASTSTTTSSSSSSTSSATAASTTASTSTSTAGAPANTQHLATGATAVMLMAAIKLLL